MKDYNKLKEVIQAANPEIMELKFGCELKYPGYQTATICGQQLNCWKVWCERQDEAAFKVVTPVQLEFSTVIHILGRPIRLSDVLVACNIKFKDEEELRSLWFIGKIRLILEYWSLIDDNLDHQNDECKKFLIDLLVN